MKKYSIYALMGAIALAGSVGFSSCSSSSDEVITNPDYNPETNSVKTAITLSVNPANTSAGTRQTNAIVQAAGAAFRGITSITMVPSSSEISGTTPTTGLFHLDPFTTFDNSSTNYKLYSNQDVTVGVKYFLFLGKASGEAVATATAADKLAKGFTDNTSYSSNTVTAVSGLTVTPGTILTESGEGSDWATQSAALAEYLLTIANATGWKESTNASLNNLYNKFCRTDLTAGSANAVLLTLQNLYRKVDALDATIKTNIRNAIVASGKAEVTSGEGSEAVLGWQSSCTFKDFPTSLGLPEGAAHYKYVPAAGETAAKFEYTAATSTDNTLTTAATSFVYPNELYYLTSTPIRATATKTVTWPNSVANWKDETWPTTGATTIWTDAVAGDTKNIALKYNIQYGSALLATQVKCAAATLYDNSKLLDEDQPATNKAINVAANSFKLTGVIVGSQPQEVGWNFLPTSTTGFGKALYDRVSDIDVSSTTAYSTVNYTLVFDNLNTDDAIDKDVNICLEFLNNSGEDFYGKDGLILNGQKFYLVGKLNVSAKTTPITTEETDDQLDAFLPSRALRAFIQDYTTTAQFQLTAGSEDNSTVGSLAKALTSVPDLRTSSQEIGLSVDLTWQTGLTFENIVLGQ